MWWKCVCVYILGFDKKLHTQISISSSQSIMQPLVPLCLFSCSLKGVLRLPCGKPLRTQPVGGPSYSYKPLPIAGQEFLEMV